MNDVRQRYLTDAVQTAGPTRLLTMLYDRLLVDLDRAEASLQVGDRGAASQCLVHAQDIVGELMSSLDTDAWDGAEQLLSLYGFVLTELVEANVRADVDKVRGCRELVAPLASAWHEAADQAPAAPVRGRSVPQFAAAGGADDGSGLLGVG
ncbi:flagellar export chaperone FliS [Cellulomonas soli]